MTSQRRFSISLLVACCLSMSHAVWIPTADAQGRPMSAQERERMSKLIADAQQDYLAGRYEEAASKYIQAQTIEPEPNLDYNIGRSYDKMGRCEVAQSYYKKVIKAKKARPENLKKAQKYLAALGGCKDPNATDPTAQNPPKKTQPKPKKTSALFWVGLSSVVLGGATMGTGLIVDISSASLKDDYTTAANQGDRAEYDRLAGEIEDRQSLIYTMYGAGAGLAVLGSVLMVVDGMGEEAPQESASGVLIPTVRPDQVGATWRLDF